MSRKTDRRHAFNLAFQMLFRDEPPEELFGRYFNTGIYEELGLSAKADKDFILSSLNGIYRHSQHIDRKISELARGFTVNRLQKTDLAILRIAVYELLYSRDVPPKVAINEAVELSKLFSSHDSPAFVNGLLAQIVKLPDVKSEI